MTTDETQLPPTQFLVVEVLAARHRLGSGIWVFPVFAAKPLKVLESRGLVGYKDGIVEKTVLAWLTPEGIKAWGLDNPWPPVPPVETPQPDQPTVNLLHQEQRGLIDGIRHMFRKRNNCNLPEPPY